MYVRADLCIGTIFHNNNKRNLAQLRAKVVGATRDGRGRNESGWKLNEEQ